MGTFTYAVQVCAVVEHGSVLLLPLTALLIECNGSIQLVLGCRLQCLPQRLTHPHHRSRGKPRKLMMTCSPFSVANVRPLHIALHSPSTLVADLCMPWRPLDLLGWKYYTSRGSTTTVLREEVFSMSMRDSIGLVSSRGTIYHLDKHLDDTSSTMHCPEEPQIAHFPVFPLGNQVEGPFAH